MDPTFSPCRMCYVLLYDLVALVGRADRGRDPIELWSGALEMVQRVQGLQFCLSSNRETRLDLQLPCVVHSDRVSRIHGHLHVTSFFLKNDTFRSTGLYSRTYRLFLDHRRRMVLCNVRHGDASMRLESSCVGREFARLLPGFGSFQETFILDIFGCGHLPRWLSGGKQ